MNIRAVISGSILIPITLVLALCVIPVALSQKSGTETKNEYNSEGRLVKVENTYDNGRLVERKEFDIGTGKLRRRITYKYLKGFKEPDTSTTNYQPDGTTAQSTTNVDHDKDGNPTTTVTTNYDGSGKETGGSKRERDSKTGKERCYNWNPAKQLYEEIECPKPGELANQKTDNVKVETGGGLIDIRFGLGSGDIVVKLPDDMRAGDILSGTVLEEPKRSSSSEDERRLRETRERLYLDWKYDRAAEDRRAWLLITSDNGTAPPPINFKVVFPDLQPIPIILRDKDGNELGAVTLPSTDPRLPVLSPRISESEIQKIPTAPDKWKDFDIPSIGQQGRPIEIFGPFDGDSSNTHVRWCINLTVSDCEKNRATGGTLQPVAESPRKLVVDNPINVAGPIQIEVKDGQIQTHSNFRNVGVSLTAPKTSLLRGEKTTLTTKVEGLQGITQPVPLTLEANGVITMEGGTFQQLYIQPSQVSGDGSYVTTRGITGLQAGGWSATSTVVTQPFNIILRDPDPPQTLVFNSFTGAYTFCSSQGKLSGIAKMTRDGCNVQVSDLQNDHELQGSLNACTPIGTGRYWIYRSPGTTVDLRTTVSSTVTSTTVTVTVPTRTKVYFNPLSRPAPPVQDVSAFATCP